MNEPGIPITATMSNLEQTNQDLEEDLQKLQTTVEPDRKSIWGKEVFLPNISRIIKKILSWNCGVSC